MTLVTKCGEDNPGLEPDEAPNPPEDGRLKKGPLESDAPQDATSGDKPSQDLEDKAIWKKNSLVGFHVDNDEESADFEDPNNLGCNETVSNGGQNMGEDRAAPTKDDEGRQNWSNPIEFLLSCISLSVGLGNVWRFPFTAYENGGGAFLVPYLIVLMLIGRPLYFLELCLGQFTSRGNVKIWDLAPLLRGVGYGQVLANFSVCTYYTCLIALAIRYFVASFSAVLPWTVCDETLQMEGVRCVASQDFGGANSSQAGVDNATKVISSVEQYFKYSVLHQKTSIEDGIGLPNPILTACLFVSYVLLFLTLWKGVASSGKVSYFTALFPYVVLLVLVGKGFTLPGSTEGIMFYITPKWEALLEIKVWYNAVSQAFFSLSVGFGSIITYSSYNKFDHNIYRDALIISVVDTFTSLLAGCAIFTILGNLALEMKVPIEKVVDTGVGLAFISYPAALGKFYYAPQVFSVLFFLMLIALGMGSAVGLYSCFITIVCDNFPKWNKVLVTFCIIAIGFLIGLIYVTPGGQHMLTLVDFFGGEFLIFLFTILEAIGVSWIYGLRNFVLDVKFMLDINLGIYWKLCWGFIVPGVLLFFFIYFLVTFEGLDYAGEPFPQIAIVCGWILVAAAFAPVPIFLAYHIFNTKEDSLKKRISMAHVPNALWGPQEESKKQEWMEHHRKHSSRLSILHQTLP